MSRPYLILGGERNDVCVPALNRIVGRHRTGVGVPPH